MTRWVSFIVLLCGVLLLGALFLNVMAEFLLPMFLAVLLVVMFRPLHEWFLRKCHGHRRPAAGLTTAAIVLIVLLPLILVLARAASEGYAMATSIDQETLQQTITAKTGRALDEFRHLADRIKVEIPSDRDLVQWAASNLESWIAPAAMRTTRFLGSTIVGLGVMLVSLYFFLADGSTMVETVMKLIPLESRYEGQLLDQFVQVSRAVVLATVLSALGQGLLAFVAYWFVGLHSIFLLTVMTMLLSLMPIVGTATVWVPCSLWLYFYEERTGAAIGLALWGTLVVSLADHLIKPMVLHGQSNLHPLLALLSVLGGLETLGPIGIFVGPMAVAFLQALLVILRTEIEALGKKPVEALSEGAVLVVPPVGNETCA
jgi:predicted PurR-regulated permease PerM